MVGSIPLESVENVFRTCGELIGPYVSSLPDGEVDERAPWIGFLAQHVYDPHPDLETVGRPDFSKPVKTGTNNWSFKVRPGAESFRFGDLRYGDIALESYAVFKRLRDEGVVPGHVRFQLCLPLTGSAVYEFFQDPSDWDVVMPAYEDAIVAEIEKVSQRIPAEDLVIQFDACLELRDIQGDIPWAPQDKFERAVSAISRLGPRVPEEVLLGYHWCYGTLGGWPMVRVDDLGLCVRLSNEAAERSGRTVDYVHMPIPRHVDADYLEPLADLDVGDARVYLGMVHHTDGVDGFKERLAKAQPHLPADFGVASVCGYGRLSPDETRDALRVHRDVGEELGQNKATHSPSAP